MADIDNMRGDTLRVVEENTLDNMRGVTQRVISENSIDNTRGVTYRVYNVNGGSAPVIDELNVTPSTSAQTITAPEGTDGYSPVNVSAVDSTIDANITSGNIKSGVSILGVSGNVVELNGTTASVTPTTSAQTISPTAPSNGFTEVNVSAVTSSIDANITAGNIKKDVNILGVTGSYEGNVPTGTMYIISNGTYNVADKAIANVQVPTTAPAYYVEKTVDANGKLINSATMINLNGVTDVGNYALASVYYDVLFPANTSINLSSLTTISGQYACQSMFVNCSRIKSVDLSGLTTISGQNACQYMFQNCTGITSIDLSGLTTISGQNAFYNMLATCTNLTSINLSSLTTISGVSACQYMFQNCNKITSIDLSSLTTISGQYACSRIFTGCTSLATVYIGGTTAIDFGAYTNQFSYMFTSCTQNIDVYAPAANQTQIEAMSGYPNFSGTGTVTWHWRS